MVEKCVQIHKLTLALAAGFHTTDLGLSKTRDALTFH